MASLIIVSWPIARADLLRAVIYPDSDDTTALDDGEDEVYDRVEYEYNRLDQVTELTDQNGTIHQFGYDNLGRRTADTASALGADIDGTVRRIGFAYGVNGMVSKVTSYSDTAGNTTASEVVFEYNDLGMLTREYQEHSGAKDGSTLYVDYAYDDTAVGYELTHGMRPEMVTYPNGRKLHFGYSGADDDLGRISYLADDNGSGSPGTHLADYTRLGLGQIVQADYGQPDLRWDLAFGAGDDPYDGLDAFGRVVDMRWIDYGPDPDVDAVRIKHAYGCTPHFAIGTRFLVCPRGLRTRNVRHSGELPPYRPERCATSSCEGNAEAGRTQSLCALPPSALPIWLALGDSCITRAQPASQLARISGAM